MARPVTQFKNHQNLGAFPVPSETYTPPVADGLTSETEKIIAADVVKAADGKTNDEEASRSGEVEIQIYKAETLPAALALFGGSESELVKAAVAAFNDKTRNDARRHIVNTVQGPEKVVNKLLTRLAKDLGVEFATLRAKVDNTPGYLDMLLSLAK